mgnify:CR=1 FL=1
MTEVGVVLLVVAVAVFFAVDPQALSVNNKTIPEVDISYFINKNVAVELILTVPQNDGAQTFHL